MMFVVSVNPCSFCVSSTDPKVKFDHLKKSDCILKLILLFHINVKSVPRQFIPLSKSV